jgi:hypothetical protein
MESLATEIAFRLLAKSHGPEHKQWLHERKWEQAKAFAELHPEILNGLDRQ